MKENNLKFNINDKKRKLKFDARIITIYYNENKKVLKLTIKDNQNKNIVFVPLDIKQYLNLFTSNEKLN